VNKKWTEYCKLASLYDKEEHDRWKYPNLTKSSRISGHKRKDKRSPFQKDRDRIIHCAAFRRLQGKTQVFGVGGSDFFRTRLTHSLEAAQIGKGIVIHCGHANMELVEAACLAHDIGHPPFGHTGEHVLKELMRNHGGFEGNAQNLRILTELEVRSAMQQGPGLNITRATIDSLLKYKIPYSELDQRKPIDEWKFYYDCDEELVKWASLNEPFEGARSFECQIMNWADDIAYSTHDLEDGIKVGMISKAKIDARIKENIQERLGDDWNQTIWKEILDRIGQVSPYRATAQERKGKRRDLIASLIDEFIQATAPNRKGGRYPSRYQYELKVKHQKEVKCRMLKSLVWELIINDERIATLQRKARTIVQTLFEELTKFDDKDRTREMYPLDFREKLDKAKNDREKYRIACDFIAGMTDNYATRLYSRLTEGEEGSLMDII
jgi:dGTPase